MSIRTHYAVVVVITHIYCIVKTKLRMLKSFSLYVFLISKGMISLGVFVYIWVCLIIALQHACGQCR